MPRRVGSLPPPSSAAPPPPSAAPPPSSKEDAPPPSSAAPQPSSKGAPQLTSKETLLRAPTSPRLSSSTMPRRVGSGAPPSSAAPSPSLVAPLPSSKEGPQPTTKEALLRAPTSVRRNPKRGVRGASAAPPPSSTSEEVTLLTTSKGELRSSAAPSPAPLEVALSAAVRPKIRFVTCHGVETPRPTSDIRDQLSLGPTVTTSVIPSPDTSVADEDEKRKLRIQSLRFKGIGGIAEYGSHKNELALVYDEDMTMHKLPDYHTDAENAEECELPERLTHIMDKLVAENLQKRFDLFKPDEAPTSSLLAVHESQHVKNIETLWMKNADERKTLAEGKSIYLCPSSGRAALLAAGGAIKAGTLVVEGMYKHSFAVIRPPGHHAGKKGPSGFCLLNNVAVSTMQMLKKYDKKRIVIVDFDIHHGNGTQEIFYDENRVLFISIHRSGSSFYPATTDGDVKNIGNGPGRGFNVNCCVHHGAKDADYISILEGIVIPLIENYGPDMIFISAGFDAAVGDPLGGCNVSPNGYATIVDMLMKLGSLVLILEGGYNLDALAECVSACIKVLSGDKSCVVSERRTRPSRSTTQMIKKTKQILSEVWEFFKDDQKKAVAAPKP